jgi:hypothetical protein
MHYEIRLNFDDEIASLGEQEAYSRVADKYHALCIGHDKTRTSSMFVKTSEPLNLEELAKEFGDIKILKVLKAD